MQTERETAITGHHWRNGFHIEAPYGLINDPNGLSYFDGKYHLFFQWNPNGCAHKTKHWGLVTTKDFARYSKPRLVLCPGDAFDKDGCYSGCAVPEGDVLRLYYTGNVKGARGERISYQCTADYGQDGALEKQGVCLAGQPKGYTAHWRDPYVFEHEGTRYMIVGAQTDRKEGAALLYRENGAAWELKGALKTDFGAFGYMWECPNFARLGGNRYAFLFSPQGLAEEPLRFQNLYQSGYAIGDFDPEAPELRHGAFRELDMGFDFYAPQVFTHAGRTILIGWVGMPDRDAEYPTAAHGWMYSLTMPREMTERGGRLCQTPLAELAALRGARLFTQEEALARDGAAELSRSAEIALDLALDGPAAIVFAFGEERVVFSYDPETGVAALDRRGMRLGGRGVRRFALEAPHGLELRIFIDRSLMEIYYQDGEAVTTLAYFPEMDCELNLRIEGAVVRKCEIWRMSPFTWE